MLRIFAPFMRQEHVAWMKIQTAKNMKARVLRLFCILLTLCVMHSLAIMYFEGLPLADAVWLTMTTVTTVGYGDFSAATPGGRIATILFIYISGISLLAQVAGEFLEAKIERRYRMITGQWKWKTMKDHILIINVPNEDSSRYLTGLVKQIRCTPELKNTPIQILADHFTEGLPIVLRELGVVHRAAAPDKQSELLACNINSAKYILVLAADSYDPHSDAMTLNILLHMHDLGIKRPILAEAVLDENRQRFTRFGASSVLRPIRSYPEILVRALTAPGAEVIMEDLFSYGGVYPQRVDVHVSGVWSDIAIALIKSNHGVPLGYVSKSGHVEASPSVDHNVDAKALLLMVTPSHAVTVAEVRKILKDTHKVTVDL